MAEDKRTEHETSRRMLDKLRMFVIGSLDDRERRYLAALLAPGLAQALGTRPADGNPVVAQGAGGEEVTGFSTVGHPGRLPEALIAAVLASDLQVTGWEHPPAGGTQ